MKYNIQVTHPTDLYLAYKAANCWLKDQIKYPDTDFVGYTFDKNGVTKVVSLRQNKSSISIWIYEEEIEI